ncbi:GntR family transcriptional regulator [Pseudonocardia sp. ICBG1293]|uniref:GntR family transcriptional regulator n=1 Tax=Pseudonocardia sp. ICBG1293 TaxID=2844382 RepID=UPI001CCE501C|nr:GntR family transcriptional regulator [Pseudonocardia sp. ICBG1293]
MADLAACTVLDVQRSDPDDSRPPYQQVAETYRRQIKSGEVAPGDPLPSYSEAASLLGVSPGVVKRAFAELRNEGLIVIRHGQGSFVRTEQDVEAIPTVADLAAAVRSLSERLEAVERRLS